MSWYRAPLWDLRPDITSCRNVTFWNLWSCFCGAPSLTRGWVRGYFTTDSQSVSMSWYRAPLWDLQRDITSCQNVAVWNLRSCFCGAPSLTTGRVYNLQCNHSMVRRAEPVTILHSLIWDSPNLEGQVPIFISPNNRVAQLYSWALGFVDIL
jgi:hypothetical protein